MKHKYPFEKHCKICNKSFFANDRYQVIRKKTCSKECMKKLMSNLKLGIPINDSHKDKISKSLTGRVFSEKHKESLKISRTKQSPPTLGMKFTQEQKNRMKEACITRKHRVFKDTKIEIKIEQELIKYKLKYTKQEPLCKIAIVDFYIPEYKIIIECDGDYWHNLPGRKDNDNKKDSILTSNGYFVFRFTEKDINLNPKECVSRVISFIKELTLHVHHKHYNKGANIWEYENWELTTLCENCHSNKHNVLIREKYNYDFSCFKDDDINCIFESLDLFKGNDNDLHYFFKYLPPYIKKHKFYDIIKILIDDYNLEELKDRVDILTKKLESFKDNYGTKN